MVSLYHVLPIHAGLTVHWVNYLPKLTKILLSTSFLDFRPFPAFKPRTFSERRSFRPAARPMRPEANARQRDAPSGAKVFGISCWRLAPGHITGRHTPRRRGIQYAAAPRLKTSCSGILDHPPTRVMTVVDRST